MKLSFKVFAVSLLALASNGAFVAAGVDGEECCYYDLARRQLQEAEDVCDRGVYVICDRRSEIQPRRRLDAFEDYCSGQPGGKICPPEDDDNECPGGKCGGDPHFQTWSGSLFDYHGQCDLVFLQAPEFDDGLGLNIHIRTKARDQYSFIESAALHLGSDILEVSSFGDYKLNGVAGAELTSASMADKYPIAHKQVSEKQHSFEIRLGGKEAIVISTNKDLVGVSVGNATKANFGTSQGLMGEYLTGKMLGRDGKTVINKPDAFGQEWQVLDTEPMLFDSVSAPQYPEMCIPPGAAKTSRRLGEVAVTQDAAEMACAHWSEDHKELCVYDVMAMNDLEIADAGAF